jgi:hypothetical protein
MALSLEKRTYNWGWQPEFLGNIAQFLTPEELALDERVSKAWRERFDLHVWGEQARIQGLSIAPGGSPKDCFSHAVTGELHFFPLAQRIVVRQKASGAFKQLRWGLSAAEPFVRVQVYNDESKRECQLHHHGDNNSCENFGWQGAWQDGYHRVPHFPAELPLRFFMDQGGNREDGDKLRLNYAGQRIVLTCTYLPGRELGPTSFREALALRIKTGLACKVVTEQQVAEAQENARAMNPNKLSPD